MKNRCKKKPEPFMVPVIQIDSLLTELEAGDERLISLGIRRV